jgi:hypothetical protein
MVFEALMISLIRGTPRVTFMDATPAKWKVFNVICVPGSPIDWAPTAPTVEPEEKSLKSHSTVGEVQVCTWFDFGFDVFHPANFEELSQLIFSHLRSVLDSGHVGVCTDISFTRLISKQVIHTRSTHRQIRILVPLVLPFQCVEHPARVANSSQTMGNMVHDESANGSYIRGRALGLEFGGGELAVCDFKDFEREKSTTSSRGDGLCRTRSAARDKVRKR